MEWKPIKTAPKDGTKVDLWYPHDIGRVADSYWHPFLKEWAVDEYCDFPDVGATTRGCNPTHWMPIPSGPKK